MVAASKDSIGTWLVSIFCKRVNSVANQAVTKWNYLLATDETCMLTTFRTNREFIRLMRESRTHSLLRHSQDFMEEKEEEE